jgi:UDP-2-acetamido-3-amino-2,3-dideoxy-glucuronate N-acetyltransferase
MTDKLFFVHPSAIADEGAVIGAGTKVWHFCHLMPKSVVGSNCILGQNVFIDNNAVIGSGVKIQNNVSVYTGVEIEDDVFLGPSMVFTNVINPRSFIERKNEFKKTIIRKGATIGANATVICGIEIGSYAMIGAGAVLTKNISAFALMVGNPATQIGWVSEAGCTLNFNNEGVAICLRTGIEYFLADNQVVKNENSISKG